MSPYVVFTSICCLVLSVYCLNAPDGVAEVTRGGGAPDPHFHINRLGFPNNNSVRYFENYILSYDTRLRLASWVFEHLTAEAVKPNKNVTGMYFTEDETIHVNLRAKDDDYRRNILNMTRGHLAAAANHQSDYQKKLNTYVFSNIAPQIGAGFNNGMWSVLEDFSRKLTASYRDVFVVTGPLFLPVRDGLGEYVTYRLLGNSRIAVPTHFYKVILAELDEEGLFKRWTFVLPHEQIPKGTKLDVFLTNITNVEKDSGLLFFDRVPSHIIQTATSITSL